MDQDNERCNCAGCRDCDGFEVGCNCEIMMELEKEALEQQEPVTTWVGNLGADWQPGDPVYPDERVPHVCGRCGAVWARGSDIPATCPGCDAPATQFQP